jgi:hypothetical protein
MCMCVCVCVCVCVFVCVCVNVCVCVESQLAFIFTLCIDDSADCGEFLQVYRFDDIPYSHKVYVVVPE